MDNRIKDILKNARQYDFMQIISLLGKNLPSADLLLIADDSLNFSASDISRCNITDNKVPGIYTHGCLTSHFIKSSIATKQSGFAKGYAGVICLSHSSSGLYPRFPAKTDKKIELQLTFMSLSRNLGYNSSIKNLLNIFNQRIYQLLYLAWKKYAPIMQTEQIPIEFRVRNSIGLEKIISEYFSGGTPVSINQFVPAWINLGNTLALGKDDIFLGDNAILGDQTVSLAQKIEIKIGPLSIEQAMDFHFCPAKKQQLNNLIVNYIGSGMTFDIVFLISPHLYGYLQLGDDIKLGWTSQVGGRNLIFFHFTKELFWANGY